MAGFFGDLRIAANFIGEQTGLNDAAEELGFSPYVHGAVHALEEGARELGVDKGVHFADAVFMDAIEVFSGKNIKYRKQGKQVPTTISQKQFDRIIAKHNRRVGDRPDARIGIISMCWREVRPEDLIGILKKYKNVRFRGGNVQHDEHHGHILRQIAPGLQDEKQRYWDHLLSKSDFGLQIGNISSPGMMHEQAKLVKRARKKREFTYIHIPGPNPDDPDFQTTCRWRNYTHNAGGPLSWRNYRAIRLASDTNWVIDIAGGKAFNGANLILYRHHGGPNQQFLYDGRFLRSLENPKYCIAFDPRRMRRGENIIIWECNGGKHQQWHYDGAFFRSAMNRTYVIDLDGNSLTSGANIHLWKENGTGAQKWNCDRISVWKKSWNRKKREEWLPELKQFRPRKST